jgi:hypothetical protein
MKGRYAPASLQIGRIALEGPARDLESNEQVHEIYLGLSTRAAAR